MRFIIAAVMLFILVFASAFSSAAVNEHPQMPATGEQSTNLSCQNQEVVTQNVPTITFAGPKMGWQQVPGEKKTVICRDADR